VATVCSEYLNAMENRIIADADRIEALEAEVARLREYYEAREAVSEIGLFFATNAMLRRENAARAALEGKDTTNDQ